MSVGLQSEILQTVRVSGRIRAVVGRRFDDSIVSFRIMVDNALSYLRQVVQTVQQVRGPEDEARSLADVIPLSANGRERTAFKERSRADDCVVSCVFATVVASPS